MNLLVLDTSPSTATLAWSAPEKANGVIQHYEVLCENETFSKMVDTLTNRVILTHLKPFSYYNVSVRAYTRFGHGNQTSDILNLLSGEDGVLKDAPAFLNAHMFAFNIICKNIIWCLFLLQSQAVLHMASLMSQSVPVR